MVDIQDALKELKRTWAMCSPTSQETHSAVMTLIKFIDEPNKHSEITTHHCDRCGKTWEFTCAKDVPMKIIDCGCSTQNWGKSKISDPEYKEVQRAENVRLRAIVDGIATKT